jgi:putative ABC transport system permease protein
MFSHYLTIALRNLYRDKGYAFTNILGLSLAVTCALILGLYVREQLTYDKHNRQHQKIVRVVNEIVTSGVANNFAITSQALGPLFSHDYPDMGEFVRVRNMAVARNIFRHGDIALAWDDVRIADENIFDVFTHDVVYGQFEGALTEPTSIAISESFARSYFGDRNPIGKAISTDTFTYKVTVVFEDLPANSHLKYSALLPMSRLGVFGISDNSLSPQQLLSITGYTYFLLDPGVNQAVLQRSLDDFAARYTTQISQRLNSSVKYFAQPLAEIHFDRGFAYDQPTGNLFYVYAFVAVALFVIVVACINYTNLATARATKRAQEIALRKIIGASRAQLVVQFVGEAIAFAVLAVGVGTLTVLVLSESDLLSDLLGARMQLDLVGEPGLVLWLGLGALLIGLLSGAYPALYLSSIPILSALAVNRVGGSNGFSFRNFLVFLQLFVSIAVIAATILMALQMEFVAKRPLGFERENRIAILLRGVDVLERIPVIRNEFLKNPNIFNVSISSYVPGEDVTINLFDVENNSGQMEPTTVNQIVVGEQFLEVMGIELVEGRDFSTRLLTDVGASLIVNESLVTQMGWDSPLGKRIRLGDGRVIGVVEDFHFESLHEVVGPALLRLFSEDDLANLSLYERNLVSLNIVLSIHNEDVFETIEYVESVVAQFDSSHPFEFRFFDDLLNKIYIKERNLIKLTGIFSAICIFISCLGLFGLAAFTTALRTKEIGIRKVLGASTLQIVILLSRTLLILVVVAAVFASATTFFVIREWLRGFAYHTAIEGWAFLTASALIAVLGLTTVALQSIGTAAGRPADALRQE